MANAFQVVNSGYLTVSVHNYYSCAVRNFFESIAKQENLKISWYINNKFDNLVRDMEQQKFDVSADGISNINKLVSFNALASEPYLKVFRGFTVLKNSQFASLKKLPEGAKVAVMNHSSALEDIQKNYPPHFFRLKIVNRIDNAARRMLRSGEVDAISEGATGFWFNPNDAKDLVMIDVHPLDKNNPDAESLVFWVQPGNLELLDKINAQLKKQGNIYQYYQRNGMCNTSYVFETP